MLVIYCCDIGSIKRDNFGWVRAVKNTVPPSFEGNNSIDDCIDQLGKDIADGHIVTLGLECPLFLPIPAEAKSLSSGRTGERDRSCFAPAGGYVATLGIHETAYILAKIQNIEPILDWQAWDQNDHQKLLLWEAFVTAEAHSDNDDHCQDAATATNEFIKRSTGVLTSDVSVAGSCQTLSLAGAAILWSKLSKDIDLLHKSPLVIKPTTRYEGAITKK